MVSMYTPEVAYSTSTRVQCLTVFQITHNLCIPSIPAIRCTIVMTFLDCILTSGLNL